MSEMREVQQQVAAVAPIKFTPLMIAESSSGPTLATGTLQDI